MKYQTFRKMVRTICTKAGIGIKPVITNEDGVFTCLYDDIRITANSQSTKLTVNWGSGHQAQIPASEVACCV